VRVTVTAEATADDQGAVVFLLDPPPPGKVWTGNLAVPGASAGARFAAQLGNGLPLGEWVGPVSFGPAQAMPGEQLTVTGSGLTVGAPYTLSLVGEQTSPELAPTVYPSPSPAPQQRSSLGYQLLDLYSDTPAPADASYGPLDVSAFDGLLLLGFADAALGSGDGMRTTLQWSFPGSGDPVAMQEFETYNDASLVTGSAELSLVVPVLAPQVELFTTGTGTELSPSLLAGMTAPLPKHRSLVTPNLMGIGHQSIPLMTETNLGAGVSATRTIPVVSPGPWQLTVFVGNYDPGPSVVNVAWELFCFELDYLGAVRAPVAGIDGTARATQASKSAIVELGANQTQVTIVNRSAGAQLFTVTATPAGALV
jgi:hypothetical protein